MSTLGTPALTASLVSVGDPVSEGRQQQNRILALSSGLYMGMGMGTCTYMRTSLSHTYTHLHMHTHDET